MYTRLYKHLSNLKILCPKQFGFLNGHSIDHALLQLVDQIYESFECNEITIGVFIDLSKTFDTVNDNILLKKIEIYSLSSIHLQWFRNYLNNRKLYIQIDGWQKMNYKTVKPGVPQGSRCSTGMHFRTSPFFSLYQRSSVHFISTWLYYVC